MYVQLKMHRNRLTTINACAFDNALELEEIWLTGNTIIIIGWWILGRTVGATWNSPVLAFMPS